MNSFLLDWTSPFKGVNEEISKEFMNTEDINDIKYNFLTHQDSLSLADLIQSRKNKEVIYFTEAQLDSMDFSSSLISRMNMYNTHFNNRKEYSASKALKQLQHEDTWWNRKLYERILNFDNIELTLHNMIEYVLAKLPLIIFFFLPLFALLLWLLYIRQPLNYMEHLIFTFHQQTVFFILFGLGTLVSFMFKIETPRGILIIIFLFYLYKSMLKFYRQNWFKTTVKFLLANLLFFTLAIVGVVFTFLGAAILF